MTKETAILLPLDVVERLVGMACPSNEIWMDGKTYLSDKEALAIAEREIAQVKEMVGRKKARTEAPAA